MKKYKNRTLGKVIGEKLESAGDAGLVFETMAVRDLRVYGPADKDRSRQETAETLLQDDTDGGGRQRLYAKRGWHRRLPAELPNAVKAGGELGHRDGDYDTGQGEKCDCTFASKELISICVRIQ